MTNLKDYTNDLIHNAILKATGKPFEDLPVEIREEIEDEINDYLYILVTRLIGWE